MARQARYLDVYATVNLGGVLEELKSFDEPLAREVRKRLRAVGDDVFDEMRGILRLPSLGVVTGHTLSRTRGDITGSGQLRWRVVELQTESARWARSRGARESTAAGLRTGVYTPKFGRQAVKLTAPGDAFSRSYNKKFWRHPVRFDPEKTTKNKVKWVEQAGRPYFGMVVLSRQEEILREVNEAIADALAAIEAHTGSRIEL